MWSFVKNYIFLPCYLSIGILGIKEGNILFSFVGFATSIPFLGFMIWEITKERYWSELFRITIFSTIIVIAILGASLIMNYLTLIVICLSTGLLIDFKRKDRFDENAPFDGEDTE